MSIIQLYKTVGKVIKLARTNFQIFAYLTPLSQDRLTFGSLHIMKAGNSTIVMLMMLALVASTVVLASARNPAKLGERLNGACSYACWEADANGCAA